MDIRYHIGRRLAAVAVVGGGGAAALFGGAAAHTQFSATTTNNVVLGGSTVAETITNGSFACSGLTPPNNAVELGGSGTYPGSTCTQTVSFNNTGTIRESFDMTINSVTGTPSALANLGQLTFTVDGVLVTGNPAESTAPFHIATIAPGASLSAPVVIGLAADSADTVAVQNAWNGASITINYTVTATPSDS